MGSDQKDTGTIEEKQSFPLKRETKRGKLVPEALRKQTSNGWEKRRAEFEEVNDSDSLKCNSSFVIGRRGEEEGGGGGWEGEAEGRGGGEGGKRGPFRKWTVHHNG